MSARVASCALVAGPCASCLKSSRRSPMLAIMVVVRPLVSLSTLPKNVSVFAWSTLCCVVMSVLLVLSFTESPSFGGEFIEVLSLLELTIPGSITRIFLILDNVKMHKGQLVQAWLSDHPRFVCHFTPVHCSRMNQVEQWFSILQHKRLHISDFSDLDHLAERL